MIISPCLRYAIFADTPFRFYSNVYADILRFRRYADYAMPTVFTLTMPLSPPPCHDAFFALISLRLRLIAVFSLIAVSILIRHADAALRRCRLPLRFSCCLR